VKDHKSWNPNPQVTWRSSLHSVDRPKGETLGPLLRRLTPLAYPLGFFAHWTLGLLPSVFQQDYQGAYPCPSLLLAELSDQPRLSID
jgi:hypothetical protein